MLPILTNAPFSYAEDNTAGLAARKILDYARKLSTREN